MTTVDEVAALNRQFYTGAEHLDWSGDLNKELVTLDRSHCNHKVSLTNYNWLPLKYGGGGM